MGWAKRQMEEEEDRGWRASPGRFVCLAHIEEAALASYLASRLEPASCSYCDQATSAAPLDVLTERLAESLPLEWTDPVNVAPRDGGEYVAVSPIYDDLWDLFSGWDEGNPVTSSSVIADLHAALFERAWTQRDFFDLRPGDRLAYGWDRFSELVKHDRRFFFLGPADEDDWASSPTPQEILEAVGEAIDQLGLIRTLPEGTVVYRGRAHGADVTLHGADQLGPPRPEQFFSANRMSPAGIAHFYGALSEETAIRETAAADADNRPSITVGRFVTSAPLRVITLEAIPQIPSLFSDERQQRPIAEFLHHFQAAVTQPTPRDGEEHVEYVPSQIVTEWIRTAFTPLDGGVIDGVAYPSARHGDGTNVGLFLPKNEVGDEVGPGIRAVLAEARTASRPPE